MNVMDTAEMNALLSEISELLPSVTWTQVTDIPDYAQGRGATFYKGAYKDQRGEDWVLTVTSFPIADQGFPPGTLGHDGACANHVRGVVCRLTRPMAERAYQLASARDVS